LRELDLELRREYFAQRRFAERGAWLLLAGMIVALAAGRWAATLKRPLPTPSGEAAGVDMDERIARIGRWAVAVLTTVIIAGAVFTAASVRSDLPRTAQELARRYPAPPPPDEREPPVAPLPGDGNGPRPEPGGTEPDGLNGGQPATGGNGSAADAKKHPTQEELQANWHRFRGYQGAGVSPFADPPRKWDGSSGEGVVWKTSVPLPGNSSPIVWEDRVFLTGATQEKREVYCFHAGSGEILWTRAAAGTPESTTDPPKVSEGTGYAAPTAVTDGHGVFAMFANGDVVAVELDGTPRWECSLGIPVNCYGHASSLAIYRDRLIIQFDQALKKDKKSRLLALDTATGKVVWETPREVPNSWPTPIVIQHEEVWQIIAGADPWVIAYTADDGKELWRAKRLEADVGPSPVYFQGIVYVANEFPNMSATRAGGTGDVTESHLEWEADYGVPDCCSPLVTDDFVLLVASYGTVTCYDRKSGDSEPLWEEDFDGSFTSSPSLAGGLVYLFAEEGQGWIIEATRDECRRVAENQLGEDCVTSPAFQDGRLYVRGKQSLFCLGGK
jgi:outer membrane protein assembly factor BamB